MFSVNTSLAGIGAVFKEHEFQALQVIERAGSDFIGTREIMEVANTRLKAERLPVRSRATYINFVKDIADAGLLESTTKTGKGGHRDLYRLKPGGIVALQANVATRIMRSLIDAFPDVDFTQVINELEIG